MLKETIINVIKEDGTIEKYCEFFNDFTPEYNMITLCMKENKIGNVTDKELRKRFEDKIVKSGKHVFFEIDNKTYITRL